MPQQGIHQDGFPIFVSFVSKEKGGEGETYEFVREHVHIRRVKRVFCILVSNSLPWEVGHKKKQNKFEVKFSMRHDNCASHNHLSKNISLSTCYAYNK